jgi:hypothetical protein
MLIINKQIRIQQQLNRKERVVVWDIFLMINLK